LFRHFKPFNSFAEVAEITEFVARSFLKGVTTKGKVLTEEMLKRYVSMIKNFC
jgi:hypothetical protein